MQDSSQGNKATLLRNLYSDMVISDFPGDFWERMTKLRESVGDSTGWTLASSSLGRLTAAVFACQEPDIELNSWDIWV